METVVRMGEASASKAHGDVLACIGLGSCIGLALLDRAAGVAALAHVMLPEAAGPRDSVTQPHKFADLAVPALVELAESHGALRIRLEAALVGGAAMFKLGGSGQDIGVRNQAAIEQVLDALRIPVRATATGGGKGRTMRVHVGRAMTVTVREAGGREQELLGASPAPAPSKEVVA